MGTALDCKIPIGLAEALVALGISPAQTLAIAQLPADLLESTATRVSVPDYFALWHAIRSVSGDPNIGLELGRSVQPDHTEPLFLATMSAASVADAIQIVSAYKRLLSPEDVVIRQDEDADQVIVTFRRSPGLSAPQALIDSELSFVVDMCRRGTRLPTFAPKELRLRLPELEAGSRHAQYLGCPVRLGEMDNELVFTTDDFTRPFVTSNPPMLGALVPYLKATTPPRAGSTVDRVRLVIAERLRGRRPTVEMVANDLAMSVRTMQRLLSEERATFREVLDQVRNDHAQGYLASTTFADAEISFLLGFEDANSFYRAFRSWNGMSPSEYRQRGDLAPSGR